MNFAKSINKQKKGALVCLLLRIKNLITFETYIFLEIAT